MYLSFLFRFSIIYLPFIFHLSIISLSFLQGILTLRVLRFLMHFFSFCMILHSLKLCLTIFPQPFVHFVKLWPQHCVINFLRRFFTLFLRLFLLGLSLGTIIKNHLKSKTIQEHIIKHQRKFIKNQRKTIKHH